MFSEIRIHNKIKTIKKKMLKLDNKSDEYKNLKIKLRTLERALMIINEDI